MLKKIMITTALTGALIGTALAQAPAPTPAMPAPGASTTTAPAPSATTTTPAPSATMTPAANGSTVVTKQSSSQWLASKFEGTDVIGTDDKKIGDVSDVLFDKNGKIEAYIVGVGGFLGIGQKDVALAPTAFQLVPADANNSYDRLRLSMTKEQLQQAASFEPAAAPARTTTGAAPAPATAPSTSR